MVLHELGHLHLGRAGLVEDEVDQCQSLTVRSQAEPISIPLIQA